MDKKDKILHSDDSDDHIDPIDPIDPIKEDIIDLNDEAPDDPDDETTLDLTDFDPTIPIDEEEILELTEIVDTLSDEDDSIVDLTDFDEDDEKQDEEVLELDDFAEESSLKKEEILITNDVAQESPAEKVAQEPVVEEEEIPELYTSIEDPVKLKENAFKPEDIEVETSFEEEVEDIAVPSESGIEMDISEVPDLDEDDLSALFDSESDEDVDEEIIELEELDSNDASANKKTTEPDDLDSDDLDEEPLAEEPTVSLDEGPFTEEPAEPEEKAFEPKEIALETSFEEETGDIVDDASMKDEDISKSSEPGIKMDISEVSDTLDNDLSPDLDTDLDGEAGEETIELEELDNGDLDEDINIEFDDKPSAEPVEFSSSKASSVDEEPIKDAADAAVEVESISPEMVYYLGPEQKEDQKIDLEDTSTDSREEEILSTEEHGLEEYDKTSDTSQQDDIETKNYVVDPESIPSEMIEEALEKVVSKMYSEKIESVLIDVIEKKVSNEIERLKNLLLNDTIGDE